MAQLWWRRTLVRYLVVQQFISRKRLQVDKGANINIIVKQRLLLRSVFLFNKLFQAKGKGARIDMDNEAILADPSKIRLRKQ